MNFTDDKIRAIVLTAEYSESEAEEYLVQTLIKRRDKIGKAYLYFRGGLDKFNISQENQLSFEDLLVKYSIDNTHKKRKITWAEFNNNSGKIVKTLTQLESSDLQLDIPVSKAEFLVAIIETPELGIVEVFIRNTLGELKVVGIKRS